MVNFLVANLSQRRSGTNYLATVRCVSPANTSSLSPSRAGVDELTFVKAVCDFPACAFGPELIKAYPDAKVVLTNRPVDAWYTSCVNTIKNSMTSPLLYFIGFFDTEVMGKWTPMTRLLFKGVFDNDFPKNGRKVFETQYRTVRELVPKEQLLEFQIGEGWDRLCEFLDVPVPEHPYPQVNEATAFKDRNNLRFRLAVKRGAPRIAGTVLTVVAVVSWSTWFWMKKRQVIKS